MTSAVRPEHVLREGIVCDLMIAGELVGGKSLESHGVEKEERPAFDEEGEGELVLHDEDTYLEESRAAGLCTLAFVEDLEDFVVGLGHGEQITSC